MISYRISVDNAHAHLYRVTVTVPDPAPDQRFSLPVWIPGSYLVREFARHLSDLSAARAGTPVPLAQLDKATWQAASGPADADAAALVVGYRVYAFDTSVRAAFLDARRGFFNGTGVFLRVEGREAEPHAMAIDGLPDGWQVATAMPARRVDAAGLGHYEAAGYDELVDHPVELGADFWHGRFEAHGVPHRFVVSGALPDFDGERLLADAKRICEAAIAFWHRRDADEGRGDAADWPGGAAAIAAPPFDRYLFLLNTVEDGYGGLEHRASTALLAARRDLPRRAPPGAKPVEPSETGDRPSAGTAPDDGAAGHAREALPDGYVTLLGLISHEYFHAWNVKRLKPRDFERIDYTRENYTELLWFFEGFTSYYDDLLLLRAGLIDAARYLKLLGKTVGNVLAAPGRGVQSVAQASFDAWVKYYRADENTPNATVSYYAKGATVALALDLSLRSGPAADAAGRADRPSLDRVMRRLWQRSGGAGGGWDRSGAARGGRTDADSDGSFGIGVGVGESSRPASGGGPIGEPDVLAALHDVAGRSFADELAGWVHGTADLPLRELLARFGVRWQTQPPTTAQRLGLRVAESALTGVKATHVLRGGAAEAAGLAAGDELLAVDDWRLRRLDDALRFATPGRPALLLVSRDHRLLRLPLLLPPVPPDDDGGGGGAPVLIADADAAAAALARRTAWLAG